MRLCDEGSVERRYHDRERMRIWQVRVYNIGKDM